MFGFGKKKGSAKANEDADLEAMMMVDPAEMMKGLENDPELMAELRALQGEHGGADEPEIETSVPQKAANPGPPAKPKPPAKAPAKPSAAEAFMANMDMSALDAENLGLLDEDNMKLEDHDMNDTGLLAQLGELGWKDDGSENGMEGADDAQAGGAAKLEEPVAPPVPLNAEQIQQVEAKIAEARARAVTLKKEGKVDEAVAEVRRLKQLETELGVRSTLGVVSDVAKAVPIRQSSKGTIDATDTTDADPSTPQTPASGGAGVEGAPGSLTPVRMSSAGSNMSGGGSPTPNVTQQRLEQLRIEAESKRKAALQMRKDGHVEEAMSFLREAKGLDAELARLMRRGSSRALLQRQASEDQVGKGGPPSPVKAAAPGAPAPAPAPAAVARDAFTPLEQALNEAVAMTRKAALALKDTDKKVAVEELRKSKQYALDLETLRAKRATPGAAPAAFQWQVETRKYKRVLDDVPNNVLQLVIKDGKELYGTTREKGPVKDRVVVTYDMGFPKDNSHKGQTAHVQTAPDASAGFNFTANVPLQRSKTELMAFGRKHVQLQIKRQKGFLVFKSEEIMTEARVDLAPLLDHCEISTQAPLYKPGNRRPCGGHLTVALRVREPLRDAEMVEEHVRMLVLGPWPELGSMPFQVASPAKPATPASSGAAATGGGKPQPPPVSPAEPKPQTPKPAAVEAEDERFKDLVPLEKTDPLSPECMMSNDVLEYELQLAAANHDKLDENDLAIRTASLQMRLNVLVLKVQREEVTMDQYVTMVKERVTRDQLLARYLISQQRKVEAGRVVKRVKIMEQELASVAAASAEEG